MADHELKEPVWGTPEWHRLHPIFGTDLSKPPAAVIENIRQQIAHARGQLTDVASSYPCYREQLEAAEGTLTCCLSYLYGTAQEMKRLRIGEKEPSNG